ALGEHGMDVAAALAAELHLAAPALPWHAERDRVVEIGCWCGMTVGTVAKIARDIALMMQTEIAETFEPTGHGRGGSSTMPHKRNPVGAAVVLSAAHRAPGLVATLVGAMPQEHERGLGGWHAEWTALPDLVRLTAGALKVTADTVAGLEVRPERMRENLDVTDGLLMAEAVMMALADRLGRLAAHERVEAACKKAVSQGRSLRDVLADEADIAGAVDLDALFDPLGYVGTVDRMIDAALARHHQD
ncbi:MAG: lyase family protein, partial [Ferrovibrionaceae bacterium]